MQKGGQNKQRRNCTTKLRQQSAEYCAKLYGCRSIPKQIDFQGKGIEPAGSNFQSVRLVNISLGHREFCSHPLEDIGWLSIHTAFSATNMASAQAQW